MQEMFVHAGGPAVSRFALKKVQARVPQVSYAEYVHIAALSAPLSEAQQTQLGALLTYGPTQNLPQPGGQHICTVLPRLGTISPWSSKATDIVHNCGLSEVLRVERGVRWYAEGERPAADQLAGLYDPMTEAVFLAEDFAQIFAEVAPRPLNHVDIADLERANADMGLALSTDEIEYLRGAYLRLQRAPTDVELMMFAQANSEHCRHKIFNADWVIDGQAQGSSLFGMIRNTFAQTNGRGVLSAYRDNAAVIEGTTEPRLWVQDQKNYAYQDEPIHVLMKVETHNHPTAIAPFPGAATGSGGEIRDEGAVGRGSKPKAGLTGFTTSHLEIPGMPQPWELGGGKPEHMASALDIMLEGPIGSASFNNEFGRPAINGYFRTFEVDQQGQRLGYHKPVMIAGGVGSVRDQHVTATDFPPGTALVVLGGPAMLIGLGGGAASSVASGTSSSELDFASVQRGNPEMERRCQEVIDACCALDTANPILLIHDVGAGGLSNALPELVHDAGAGGQFELRDVLSADRGMSPLEIWCNEAQERYVLGIAADQLAVFEQICHRERCPYAVVGRATAEEQLRVTDTELATVPVDMPLDVLLGKPPKMERHVVRQPRVLPPLDVASVTLDEAIERLLTFPAVASKQFLITIGDRSITGQVACQPMIGPWQVPVADCAVTLRGFKGYRGEAFAMGERSPVAAIDAAAAARLAVAEALTNLIAADVSELSKVVLSANWMAAASDNDEQVALYDAVRTVGEEFCPALGVAIPVGKDSLSMRTQWQAGAEQHTVMSPVTLIVSAFANVDDTRRTLTPELKAAPDTHLVLLDFGEQRLGGSCLAQVYGQLGDTPADVDDARAFKTLLDYVQAERQRGTFLAMHDRADGGLIVTLLEMAFASRLGLDVAVPGDHDPLAYLCNEEIGWVVQVTTEGLQSLRDNAPCTVHCVGTIVPDETLVVRQADAVIWQSTRAHCQQLWSKVSYAMQRLRDDTACADEEYDALAQSREQTPGLNAKLRFAPDEDVTLPYVGGAHRPRVAVLREQGVNGQLEMAAAFMAAGFECIDVHMSDLINQHRRLDDFQALVACGGFSYGDVLGAGGGWAKSVLQRPQLAEQFADYFARDHLVLGVCNGCQMLAQLRELIPGADLWPSFVRNRSEQFEGRTVLLQVNATSSPWLAGMSGSVLPVAVAHGEGRAEFAAEDQFAALVSAGDLALQYVDANHQVTARYPDNPNGSPQGLAGISAAGGRVLAMMPHPERVYRTCQNVWSDPDWGEDGPWLRMFRNAYVALST